MSTILVVEDSVAQQEMMKDLLEGSGLDVTVASDGIEALQQIRQGHTPDLVLLDIVMPKVNGIEVIETLRRNPLTNHIYTIAITGLVNPHQVQKIIDAGCDDYLLKPFLVGDLEAKIKRFLKIGLETLASDSK